MKLHRDSRRWPMYIWELFLWPVALWIEWSMQLMVLVQLVIPIRKIKLNYHLWVKVDRTFSSLRWEKWSCVSLLTPCFSGSLKNGRLSVVLPGSIDYGKTDSWARRIMTRTVNALLKVLIQMGWMWEAPCCSL